MSASLEPWQPTTAAAAAAATSKQLFEAAAFTLLYASYSRNRGARRNAPQRQVTVLSSITHSSQNGWPIEHQRMMTVAETRITRITVRITSNTAEEETRENTLCI